MSLADKIHSIMWNYCGEPKMNKHETLIHTQPWSVDDPIKAAREKLMKEREWPHCTPHWQPFELKTIMYGGQHNVYLWCERCYQEKIAQYQTMVDNTKTQDLLGMISTNGPYDQEKMDQIMAEYFSGILGPKRNGNTETK